MSIELRDPGLELSEHDFELHRRTIERTRAMLFRKYKSADYCMVPGSETISGPSTYRALQAGGMPAPRAVHYGGLLYRIKSPRAGYWYQVTVEHWRQDTFSLFLSVHCGEQRMYTRFAMTVPFREIDECLYRCINDIRAEDSQFLLL